MKDEPINIMADKEQLQRVLINLTTNAIESIPETRMGRIEIIIETQNDSVNLSISDNGKGISEELQDKLFQPYFTTKSGGTGLGLAISKNIIENMKGTLSFTSKINVGTTFTINFPVA